MLSRTADHLYWMSRYTERAENTARMLDVNYQTSLLPQSADVARYGWQGLLSISELLQSYNQKYEGFSPDNVREFRDKDDAVKLAAELGSDAEVVAKFSREDRKLAGYGKRRLHGQ